MNKIKKNNKLNILFIIPSFRGGGSERVILNILTHINRKTFKSTLALLQKKGPYLSDLPDDIDVIDLKCSRIRFAGIRIYKLILSIKPDIVMTTLNHLNFLMAILNPFFPRNIVFIARESIISSFYINTTPFTSLSKILYKKFYMNFDKIICQSSDMKNDLIKAFDISYNKITIINNPCDIDRISKLISNFPKKIKNNNITNLIAVGRLEKQKGFDLLIKAFAKLDPNRFYLTILGQGSEYNNLQELIKGYNLYDRVKMEGFKTNPYKYMTEADIFILSSRYEGFPNVVLEAMACGTPVVAFKCPGGIDEIIIDNVNGFLVKQNDIDELAEKINKASNFYINPEKIRMSIIQKFSCDKIVSKYEDVFLRLASQKV